MTEFKHPTDEEFVTESHRYLQTCSTACHCLDGWHFMWSAYKASGQRRSIYYQQPLLKKLMLPVVHSVRSVLIAGAADAGILQVLSSMLGKSVDYYAVDICQAPGREMRHFAEQNGLSLAFQQIPLQDYVPERVFDLIFISNTLIYLQPAEVQQTLRHLQLGMDSNSSVVCGMRYGQDREAATDESKANRIQEFKSMVVQTYAETPDLAALLTPHVTPFFDQFAAMNRYPYTASEFLAIVEEVGFKSLDSFRDGVTPKAVLNTFSKGFDILSDVHLLKLK